MSLISYSRAQKFAACPALFKARYVDQVPDAGSTPLLVGKFLHAILDRYLKRLKSHGLPSDFDYYAEVFARAWDMGGHGIPAVMRDELHSLMETTREAMILDAQELIGSELSIALNRQWEKVAWESATAFLRLRIDCLEVDAEQQFTITDYKTGYKIDAAATSMQLKVYGFAVRKLFPAAQRITGRFYYARFDRWDSHHLTAQDLQQAEDWIGDMAAGIQQAVDTQVFPATPGLGCPTCPVFESCEARRHHVKALPPATVADAEELLQRLILVEVERADLRERLGCWISGNGPVIVNGKMAAYQESVGRVFPGVEVRRILMNRHIDFAQYVQGNSRALQKLCRQDGALRAEIAGIAIEKSRSHLRIKNVGE